MLMMVLRCGEIKRLVMGLDRFNKTPCGFCFVEYYTHQDALDCLKYIGGTKLDERIIRTDLDPGFEEGRQYGYVNDLSKDLNSSTAQILRSLSSPGVENLADRFATSTVKSMIPAEEDMAVPTMSSASVRKKNMARDGRSFEDFQSVDAGKMALLYGVESISKQETIGKIYSWDTLFTFFAHGLSISWSIVPVCSFC